MRWFPRGPHLVRQIKNRQKLILMHHRQKIFICKKMPLASMYDRSDFLLRCKSCKIIACKGSQLYVIDDTNHHAVPGEAFKAKFIIRPHYRPHHLRRNMNITHKIFCANCNSDWGALVIETNESHQQPADKKEEEFSILKCKSFVFERNGQPMPIKKWSDTSFKVPDISVFRDVQCESEDSGIEFD